MVANRSQAHFRPNSSNFMYIHREVKSVVSKFHNTPNYIIHNIYFNYSKKYSVCSVHVHGVKTFAIAHGDERSEEQRLWIYKLQQSDDVASSCAKHIWSKSRKRLLVMCGVKRVSVNLAVIDLLTLSKSAFGGNSDTSTKIILQHGVNKKRMFAHPTPSALRAEVATLLVFNGLGLPKQCLRVIGHGV